MALSKKEERILKSIKIASENDPKHPEFPADDPKFPATPTYKIEVPGFTNVWLKDESKNPTGVHKDRMAWEIVVTYRDFLLAKKTGVHHGPPSCHVHYLIRLRRSSDPSPARFLWSAQFESAY